MTQDNQGWKDRMCDDFCRSLHNQNKYHYLDHNRISYSKLEAFIEKELQARRETRDEVGEKVGTA